MANSLRPFNDADYDELAAWLDRRRTGICDVVELEGFLTALAIGPNTVSPAMWLARVFGGKAPRFRDVAELNAFVALVMGFFNDLVLWFEQKPESFQPTFYESRDRGKRVYIVDEWCVGFLKGMRLDAKGWKPLKKDRPELLKPMELFGSSAGWKELEAGDEVALHKKWSRRIAPAVRAINAYWLPYRQAELLKRSGETVH